MFRFRRKLTIHRIKNPHARWEVRESRATAALLLSELSGAHTLRNVIAAGVIVVLLVKAWIVCAEEN